MNKIMSRVIGHRGVASIAPENTLAGVRQAAELNVRWVEMDVTLLADGAPVMFHDARLNRTTNGKGLINSIGKAQLAKLDAGGWFSSQFAGEPVPYLAETLDCIKRAGMGFNLELKPNRCDEALLVNQVIEALKAAVFPEERLLISSFSHNALLLYRAHADHMLGCLFERVPKDWRKKAESVSAVTIHVDGNKLSEKKAQQIKDAGYELYCYTINDLRKAEELMSWGVDGVFSDCPQLLVSSL